MKKIFLSMAIAIFTYSVGIAQTNVIGLDTISDPHLHYFLNNINNLIAQNDSSVNEFKDMFYKEGNLCYVGEEPKPGCSETIESITEIISVSLSRLTKEGDITFRVLDADIYYNTPKKRYSGSYDVLLINEKLGITDKIAVLFGVNSPTTFQARSMIYWFDHYDNFHPIIVKNPDGSTTDKSDYSTLKQ